VEKTNLPMDNAQLANGVVSTNALIRELVTAAGPNISLEVMNATIAALSPYQLPQQTGASVQRDLSYGLDARQKFDWYRPPITEPRASAVLVFVHGGGFVGGDKQDVPPLHDNIGWWAASLGIEAVVLNYRRAPEQKWPVGGQDVRRAIEVIAQTMREEGIISPRLFVMGHSAGAVHVATAMTLDEHPADVAGCILISGFYDNTMGRPNPAYFGEDPEQFERQSSLLPLAILPVPLFLAVAEFDPPLMQANAVELMRERLKNGGPLPQFQVVMGNNHFSPALLFNSSIDTLGPNIFEFIKRLV
jgi:acetyl esterase/lipase